MAYEFNYDYWLGADPESKRHVLGVPVSSPMVDYIEAYWLEPEQYITVVERDELAAQFADACRRREHDDLLTHQPGRNRGTPR